MTPCPCGVKPDNHVHDTRNGDNKILYWTARDENGEVIPPEQVYKDYQK